MARFKAVHKGLKLLPVDFDKQIQVGSFEHAVCYLVDHDLDLTVLHARYKNDAEGFDPGVLLKMVLLAYSRGIVSSRKIAAACREHVLFIAVSGDSQPHFTTLAAFVSELGDLAAKLFAQVLTVCDRQGLIGGEMFAIDGVKLPSNAAKARSGSREDVARELGKLEEAAGKMLAKHREADARSETPPERERWKLEVPTRSEEAQGLARCPPRGAQERQGPRAAFQPHRQRIGQACPERSRRDDHLQGP